MRATYNLSNAEFDPSYISYDAMYYSNGFPVQEAFRAAMRLADEILRIRWMG